MFLQLTMGTADGLNSLIKELPDTINNYMCVKIVDDKHYTVVFSSPGTKS